MVSRRYRVHSGEWDVGEGEVMRVGRGSEYCESSGVLDDGLYSGKLPCVLLMCSGGGIWVVMVLQWGFM